MKKRDIDLSVYGTTIHQVTINPLDVLDKLWIRYAGSDNTYLRKKDGKYFRCAEEYRIDVSTEITQDEYEFLNAIQTVKQKLYKDLLKNQKQ